MSIPITTSRQCWRYVRIALPWIWFLLVAAFVAAYIRRNAGLISSTMREFNILVLMATVAVTLAGKAASSLQCGMITSHLGHDFNSRQTFWVYSASDVVKYVPGGIWNAVTRVKLYAGAGMARRDAARAFVLDKYWQLLGALATGAIALSPMLHEEFTDAEPAALTTAGEVAFIAITWVILAFIGAHRITANRPNIGVTLRSVAQQCVIALTLGLGLFIPLAVLDAGVGWLTAVGAFSIGRGVGYVAVFAPAGIGIREVMTLWALGQGVDTDLALVALGVNRVMTFLADIASFGASLAFRRYDATPATKTAKQGSS